jgi:hypothetical protein
MPLNKRFLSISFLAVCGMAVPAFADVIYGVTVDTSSLSGNAGYIDLQFNPSSFSTQAANAAVTNFSTDGTLDIFGDVSATLPGTVSFDNGTSTNEYTQGITFGNTISFNVDLSGPAIDLPNGDGGGSFFLTFYDPSGDTLLTNNPNGPALEVDINGDGSTTPTAFANASGGPTVVTYGTPLTAATPEPSMVLLLSGGLAAMAAFRRRT